MTARLLVLALALLLAACGSDDSAETGAAGGPQEITLTDFALEPASVELDESGTLTFAVVNDGETTHALEVDGEGIEEETRLLEPGESAELTVELEDGDYELYCPVAGHREQGMEGTLLVGSGGGAADTNNEKDDDDEGDEGGDYPYGP